MTMVLVYSKRTGRIRRIIRDSTKILSEIKILHSMHAGEAATTYVNERLPNADEAQHAVNLVTEKEPMNDRYAVVDDRGIVVNVILADPDSGDFFELPMTMTLSNEAKIGWRQLKDSSFVMSDKELDLIIADAEALKAEVLLIDDPLIDQAKLDALVASYDTQISAATTEKLLQ